MKLQFGVSKIFFRWACKTFAEAKYFTGRQTTFLFGRNGFQLAGATDFHCFVLPFCIVKFYQIGRNIHIFNYFFLFYYGF